MDGRTLFLANKYFSHWVPWCFLLHTYRICLFWLSWAASLFWPVVYSLYILFNFLIPCLLFFVLLLTCLIAFGRFLIMLLCLMPLESLSCQVSLNILTTEEDFTTFTLEVNNNDYGINIWNKDLHITSF